MSLVFLSMLLRGVYFVELNRGPFIALHHWDQTDMHYFDGWGRAIAGGDWLSSSVGVPMHAWHDAVAGRYFSDHPDSRTELEREAAAAQPPTTADRLLWSRWTGGHQFYQDPLHAYLIGLTYALFGADPRYVFVWQMMLGVLTNVLIYQLTRRLFGELAGAVAGVLAVLCGPLMFYELFLLRDSTIAVSGLGIVWLTMKAIDTGRTRWFVVLGLALGLATLLKSTFALLALIVATGIIVSGRRASRPLLLPLGAMACGLAIAFGALAARNAVVGAPPLALAGSGALTFVASNDVAYSALDGFNYDEGWIADILGRTDGRLLPSLVETIRPHTVATMATVLWNKFGATWHWYEIPNNVNFYYIRLHAPVIAWLPMTFFVLSPLSLVGLFLGLQRRRAAWPLYSLVVCHVLALTLFLVLGRLRVALVAALIPFAALTIVRLVRAQGRVRLATLAAVIGLGVWTGRPLPDDRPLIGVDDWMSPFVIEYQSQVKQALDAGNRDGAVAAYLAFLRYEPDFSKMPSAGGVFTGASDREVAYRFAQAHAVCAELLRGSGRAADAATEEARARTLIAEAGSAER